MASSRVNQMSAASRESPHISSEGRKPPQNAGRSGRPNTAQRMSGSNWAHGWPAGLPCGMPGSADVIDGAIQQAPQPARHERSDWHVMVKFERQLPSIQQDTESEMDPGCGPEKAAIVPHRSAGTCNKGQHEMHGALISNRFA
jgi:hypothetical protein